MSDKSDLTEVDSSHGVTQVANHLFDDHLKICEAAEITPWDLCCALANVQAWILASSRDMPRTQGLERVNNLESIVETVYNSEKDKEN